MDENLLQQKAAFEIVSAITFDPREINTLNSLEAVSSVIRWRREPKSLARRLLNGVTGKNREFDRMFEAQTATSLRNLHDLITDVRTIHAESDLILAKTADTVVQLHGALKTFKGEVFDIIDDLRSRLDNVEYRVDALEARTEADDAYRRMRNPDRGPLTLDLMWTEIDDLWWGQFGTILRRDPKGKQAQRLAEKLQDDLTDVLRNRFGSLIESHRALPMQYLLEGVTALEEEQHEAFELIAQDPEIGFRPLTKAVLTRRLGLEPDPAEEKMVPRIITPANLADRLFNEAKRSTDE
jgi:hypothetical protein